MRMKLSDFCKFAHLPYRDDESDLDGFVDKEGDIYRWQCIRDHGMEYFAREVDCGILEGV